jgi:hypothetical protein
MSGQQEPLDILKQLSEAGLDIFDSQPILSSTVEAWVTKNVERNEAGAIRDQAGVATLISNQQVVQLLAAAVTTLLNGMAAATAGAFLTEHQMDAFHALGSSLSVILQACKEIWVEVRTPHSKDNIVLVNKERQKVEQQVAESGAGRHLVYVRGCWC